jgi:hypothetical protein
MLTLLTNQPWGNCVLPEDCFPPSIIVEVDLPIPGNALRQSRRGQSSGVI